MTKFRARMLVALALAIAGVPLPGTNGQAGQHNAGGSAQVFEANPPEVAAAITNAFESLRYHETLIIPAHYDLRSRVWSVENVTNEWQLFTGMLPLAKVPRGKKMVPYFATFDIATTSLSPNKCRVAVLTTSSWVHDGKEIGIHGGWAAHAVHVPPIAQEETNVLKEIEAQLRTFHAGDLRPLAATPDTKDAAAIVMKQTFELHPEMKADLLRAIQAETNAGFRGELLKMLMAITNTAKK